MVWRRDLAAAGLAAGGRVGRAQGPHGETIVLAYDARRRVVERRVERAGFRPKVWRYGWDGHDRLVSCATPSGERWAYGYDAFSRRVWKRRLLDAGEEAWVRGRFPGLVAPVSAGGRSALDVWPVRPAGASDLDERPPVVGTAYLWDGDVVAQEAALRLDGSARKPEIGSSTRAGGKGIQNPAVQQACDSVDPEQRHPFNHGKCCEADAFSKYLNRSGIDNLGDARNALRGGKFRAYGPDGVEKPPCTSCAPAKKFLGVD